MVKNCASTFYKAKLLLLKPIHLYDREALLVKKLEIEKTKTTFTISVLKVVYILGGLSFFKSQLFY